VMRWRGERRHDDTYRVVNAPVVGCRSWGAAWLRVAMEVVVGVASVVFKNEYRMKETQFGDAQLNTSPWLLLNFCLELRCRWHLRIPTIWQEARTAVRHKPIVHMCPPHHHVSPSPCWTLLR
jgi:hypothetical protein